jgi:RNA 3'-terminal phosphate cyclase (ATP)
MALGKGTSRILSGEPTLHTRTAMCVAEQLTSARFEVSRQPEPQRGLWRITCQGAGVQAGQLDG